MNPLRLLGRHLTYANIAATLAIVLALGGTAYAAGLAKNSVKSSTIKNGQVKSPDLKDEGVNAVDIGPGAVTSGEIADGSVTGADVTDQTITGTDVNEATLGQVKDSAALGGFPATSFPRNATSVSGNFLESSSLQMNVPGYGTFLADCSDNDTPATANDDLVSYSYFPSLGTNATSGLRTTTSSGPGVDAVVNVLNRDAGNGGSLVAEDDRMQVDHYLRSADGLKAIRVSMWGFDDSTTTGCFAVLEAQILR